MDLVRKVAGLAAGSLPTDLRLRIEERGADIYLHVESGDGQRVVVHVSGEPR